MAVRQTVAILVGKIALTLTRNFKIGGGSAAPGYYALKIDPNLVQNLSKSIPQSIIITGTNGKTTASRLISHFAVESGKKVIHNATGSNLERGIASTLINQADLLGKIKGIDLGIWELDEAAFNIIAPKVKPEVVVFLNIFRDQLDRYGEIDTVVKKWQKTLQQLPSKTQIILNGDDHNLLDLINSFKGVFTTFGIKEGKISGEKNFNLSTKKKLNVQAEDIEAVDLEKSSFNISNNKIKHRVILPLPGIYNIYNFLAAYAASEKLNIPHDKSIKSLLGFSSAFGRVEKIPLGDKTVYIFLIKNPTGTTEVLKTISKNFQSEDRILIALNDNLADGTDVSWIWDANFELVQNSSQVQSRDFKIFCSGTRAQDLALRLKYTGVKPELLNVQPNLKNALEDATKGLKGRLFILPTYTALLSLQNILASKGIKKHYWKEGE